MNEVNNKRVRETLGVVLIALLLAACSAADEEWSLVTEGDCYTYRIDSWVNHSCFSTLDEAAKEMEEFKAFRMRKKLHEDREWKDIGA